MKRLLPIIAAISIVFSCTSLDVNRTLKDVESYIMERPDSALSVLKSVDHALLNTKRQKAHHALLHAMALDKNYIDVIEDSIARVAVNFYQMHAIICIIPELLKI